MREVQEWFRRTHEIEVHAFGGAWWRLVHLPTAGAMGDQPAWLMDALDHCRHVANSLLQQKASADGDQERKTFHDAQRVH